MVIVNRGWRVGLMALVVVAQVAIARADGRFPDLRNGNTIGQVIQQWGDPKEKVERGLKGQVIWYYQNGAYVLFQSGKVIRWRSPSSGSVVETQPVPKATVATVPTIAVDSATRDLVRDIARELPSSPDAPYVEQPPAAPMPVAPGSFDQQRVVPQPAPGLAPGNPILPFGEEGED
jgi:hypothetical protein